MKEVYIGSIIRKRRQELGLTQEQLCRGICETVTLSRIENGKQTPSRSKLNALLQRLGMPGERYYALLSEQEMKISNLQTEIVSCNVRGQREQGLKKLDEADGTYDIVGDLKRKLESSEAVLRRFFTFQVARYAVSTLMAMALVVIFLLQLRIWKQAGFFISI